MRYFGAVFGALALSACVMQPNIGADGLSDQGSATSLPGWSNVDTTGALSSFVRSCKALMIMPPDTSVGGTDVVYDRAGQAGLWAPVCTAAKAVKPGNKALAQKFFETWFEVYQANGKANVSGYFEPEVMGSQNERPGFDVPLYAKPALTTLASLSRTEINDGALYRKTPVTAYVSNAIAAYMLQLQGAGRIVMPNGRILSVVYDGDNGQPYTPIGSVLVKMGALNANNVSVQSIVAWLKANPARAEDIMEQNANYVYLRPVGYLPASEGPPGAMGVNLTAEHSVAVDSKAYPLGAPIFIATTNPQTGAALNLLTVAQDTGAGLDGPDEVDVFFGAGPKAARIAGAMQQAGKVYLFLPRLTPAFP